MLDIIHIVSTLPDFIGAAGVSEEQIEEAERDLELRFAADYRKYLQAFGLACGDGHELTGICPSKRLNVVAVTLFEKKFKPDIPSDWYVLEEANIDDIVIWQCSAGAVYQTMPNAEPIRLSDSMGEYLLLCERS